MFNLTVAYVNQAEREREIEDGIRRRRMLHPADETIAPTASPTRAMSTPRQTQLRRATSR